MHTGPLIILDGEHLFLLVLGLLSLKSSTLGASTSVALLGALVTEDTVGVLGGLVVGDVALLEDSDVLDGEGSGVGGDAVGGLGSLDVLGGGVAGLGLAVAAGEEDEALLVLLEALDVGLEALLGEVLAAGVDGNADGLCQLAGDASLCAMLE